MTPRTLVIFALLVLGCAGTSEERTGQTEAAVVGGTSSPDELGFEIDRFQRNAVVGQLVQAGATQYQGCSGTVVGDRAVISAAHCVVMNQSAWAQGAEPELPDPASLFYAVGDDVRNPACLLGAASITLHPELRVRASGIIEHDISVIVLAESVIEGCPAAVPVQPNREPLDESVVGVRLLQGGFGSLDGTYDFSPLRQWALVWASAVGDDYVMVMPAQGFPTFGDSGSGLLRRFADGSLRTIGIASMGGGTLMSFGRTDNQAAVLDQVLTSEVLCGSVGPAGICRDGAAVSCGPNGFVSDDCAADGLACATDETGQAGCFEPSSCGADCEVCHEEPTDSCAFSPLRRAGGARGYAATAAALLLGLLGSLRRRKRSWRLRALLALGLGCTAGLASVAACEGDSELVCEPLDTTTTPDASLGGGGAGGAGGAPADSCSELEDLLDPSACGDGFACDIVDFITNDVGCRPAGTTAAYALCSGATEPCEAGATCAGLDPSSQRCLPYCDQTVDECPGDGVCLFSLDLTSDLGQCAAPDGCDPITSTACNRSFGLACYFIDETGRTFCLYAGSRAAGASCTWDDECRAGYGCRGTPSRCLEWCDEPSDCTAPASCLGVGDVPDHPTLGYCDELGGGGAGGAGGAGGEAGNSGSGGDAVGGASAGGSGGSGGT